MSDHPQFIINVCSTLGIDISNDNDWSQLVSQYRAANPAVDSGDTESLTNFHNYLSSQLQASQQPALLPQRSEFPNQPEPVAGSPYDDVLHLFRRVGEQLRESLPTSKPSGGSSSRGTSAKLADPPKFTGSDRKRLKSWIAHVRLKISTEESKFETEQAKVAYALSFLSDIAFTHYEQDIIKGLGSNSTPKHLQSLDSFLEHLEDNFGDKGSENSAIRELMELKQGNGPTYQYYTKFSHITPLLSWEGTAFRDLFYRGLKDDVKDQLAQSPLPETLEELAAKAIEIDNRLYERRMEKKTHSSSSLPSSSKNSSSKPTRPPGSNSYSTRPTYSSSNTTSRPSNHSTPAPMEIDAASPRKRLTTQEKQRRKDQNLCLYCGKAGHYSPNCPAKTVKSEYNGKSTPKRISSVTYTISAPNQPSESLPTVKENQ